MLLLTPKYFERLQDHDDAEARNERRHKRMMLKKKNAQPYDRWAKLREVQDPILRQARKKRYPITLPLYGTKASVSRDVDTGIHAYESERAADEEGRGFVGDYVMPEDEEFARFGETHFWSITTHYLSQYMRSDRSIDTVYEVRIETIGTFMIGDSPLWVDENSYAILRGVTYGGMEGLLEFLTKTNVDRSLVTPYDMRSYKRTLESTNGHLSYMTLWYTWSPSEGPSTETSYQNCSLRRAGGVGSINSGRLQTMNRLYYDPSQASSYSSRRKFDAIIQIHRSGRFLRHDSARDLPHFQRRVHIREVVPSDHLPSHPLFNLVRYTLIINTHPTQNPVDIGSLFFSTRDARPAIASTLTGSYHSCCHFLRRACTLWRYNTPRCRASPLTSADSTRVFSRFSWTGNWVLAILSTCSGRRNWSCL